MTDCSRGAGLHAWNVFTHITRNIPWDEVGRSDRDARISGCEFQGVIGARINTLPALDATGIEVCLWERTRWSYRIWNGMRLLFQQVHPYHSAGSSQSSSLSHLDQEVAPGCRCFMVHASNPGDMVATLPCPASGLCLVDLDGRFLEVFFLGHRASYVEAYLVDEHTFVEEGGKGITTRWPVTTLRF